MERNTAEKLFDECHSNHETPLTGSVFFPVCYDCINKIVSDDPWIEDTCKIIGTIPREVTSKLGYPCEHYIKK